jgi:hypothetical protein
MNFPRSLVYFPLALCCLMLAMCAPSNVLAYGDNWKPVDPSELALKAPLVEKDADAEALFWEVRIDDNPEGDLIFDHYIRIKIFTERGRESESKIDILYGRFSRSDIKIKDIAARTIKPDGTIIELKKEDVFERTIVKTNGLKFKAKSFAMPGIEPGAIIEYRWREVRVNQSANYIRLHFQRDIPVERVKYLIKPFPFPGLAMRTLTNNGSNDVKFVKEKDGFFSTTMTNMPAYREEPRMPPEDQVRAWTLMYYTKDEKLEPAKYWKNIGKQYYESFKPLYKVNDEVRQAATTAIGDAATPEQKLNRLFEFCRTRIKNTSGEASGLSKEESAALKENKTPADTLKRGMGSAPEIDLLFAALATAAGFDARITLIAPRNDIFFNSAVPIAYFMEPANVAVRVGEEWRFYNPGYRYIPEGMLVWQEEYEEALVTDPKDPIFVKTPLSGPEKSVEKRTAKLALSEDGTLEGDVRIEYTGHLAVDKKEDNDEESVTEREQSLRDMIKERMSTAELSNIKIENATDPSKPFIYEYHVKVPGYAQRTGKRLFLQVAFFQHGVGPLFPTSGRNHPIYFHYPWSEQDEVTINIPEGFALDNADAPAPFDAKELSRYDVKILVTKDRKSLLYKRAFFFGGGGGMNSLYYERDTYNSLKEYFDLLHKQDNHTITLKQGAATASN